MTWVKVPEADPKYIIEPVACAVNIEEFCRRELEDQREKKCKRMLIIGSGFLAKVFYQTIRKYLTLMYGEILTESFGAINWYPNQMVHMIL